MTEQQNRVAEQFLGRKTVGPQGSEFSFCSSSGECLQFSVVVFLQAQSDELGSSRATLQTEKLFKVK